jgi:mRNA-degrading endonuclease RelE of RelBE toxin-antitoxin system
MVFVETSLFSKLLREYLSDDEYRRLQAHLIERPDAGAIIRGSGGVRKVRWAAGGKGKSGGVRVIYYWLKADGQIFLLTLYGKGEQENLSAADLKRVMALVKELASG